MKDWLWIWNCLQGTVITSFWVIEIILTVFPNCIILCIIQNLSFNWLKVAAFHFKIQLKPLTSPCMLLHARVHTHKHKKRRGDSLSSFLQYYIHKISWFNKCLVCILSIACLSYKFDKNLTSIQFYIFQWSGNVGKEGP